MEAAVIVNRERARPRIDEPNMPNSPTVILRQLLLNLDVAVVFGNYLDCERWSLSWITLSRWLRSNPQ